MTAGYLDTNILVGFFKGEGAIKATLERFDSLKIPAVVYAEFLVGLPYREQRDAADQAIKTLFDIVHTDDRICAEAAELRRKTRLKLPDAMVYATARLGGGVLITRDKDFSADSPDIVVP
jgi:predicted nucleic acid-binding protein